jgi:hypothetical protein
MSTAGNQRKSKPRVRVLPEEGYILDLSVCSCAALPAFLSRSQQAESQRPNPSIRFTRKARSFSTEKQGRSRAGPGTGRPVPHRPPRRFHGAGRRAPAAACRRFIPPQCDGTGASRARGPVASARTRRFCSDLLGARGAGGGRIVRGKGSAVFRIVGKPWWVGNGRRWTSLSFPAPGCRLPVS